MVLLVGAGGGGGRSKEGHGGAIHSRCNCNTFIDQPICYPGQIVFAGDTFMYSVYDDYMYDDEAYYMYDDEGYYNFGYPTVCYNGALAPICDTADLNDLDVSTICLHTTGVLGKDQTIALPVLWITVDFT